MLISNSITQVYTLHGVKCEGILPLVYALLPNKTEQTYVEVFQALTQLNPNLKPETITTDFEQAAINAFNATFPASIHRGCYFHFTQCVWRRIQGIPEVLRRYSEDPDFALNIRLLTALAFLPPEDVPDVFVMLQVYETKF